MVITWRWVDGSFYRWEGNSEKKINYRDVARQDNGQGSDNVR
jgi:hypothetical protein